MVAPRRGRKPGIQYNMVSEVGGMQDVRWNKENEKFALNPDVNDGFQVHGITVSVSVSISEYLIHTTLISGL